MCLEMEALDPNPGFTSGIQSGAWKIAAQVVQAMKMLEYGMVREGGVGPAQQALSAMTRSVALFKVQRKLQEEFSRFWLLRAMP